MWFEITHGEANTTECTLEISKVKETIIRKSTEEIAMSLVIKQKESFSDILLRYVGKLAEIIPSIFEYFATVGFIAVVSYMFYRVYERYYKKSTCKRQEIGLQEIRNYNRSVIRDRSIISHKEMFRNLEHAVDKCHDRFYALKCIDIVVYCPQLLNVKSLLDGLTPFHRVCLRGHTYLIAFMLAKGADPFIITVAGENALCMAIYYCLNNPMQNDFSCLEILQRTGCGFGLNDKWYNVLLQLAFNDNHTKLIEWLLLHHKVKLNKPSRASSVPLL
ncbi:uncharacterized protein LOC143372992 [Andrena cerasifolii]|uniref:uncharacterized protein LOC143372992 n=1 Tax=Andrena cerasifolii TaxID=2819439 RepID=UPI004037CC86